MGGVCQHWSLPGSVEIALTADVAVAQGLVVGRFVEESAIEAALEDRTDRGDGASLDEDAASAGGIDARIVVAPGQRQDAEAGAKALLGMRPGCDDGLEKRCGRGTNLLAGGDQSSGRPFWNCLASVRLTRSQAARRKNRSPPMTIRCSGLTFRT